MSDFEGPVITNPDPNSRAAAASVEGHAPNARRRVFTLIQQHPDGLACWEVEDLLNEIHQSVSATINWLHNHGYLTRIGRNQTPSGRKAYIYAATTAEQRREMIVGTKPKPPAPVAPSLRLAPVAPPARPSRETRPCQKCGAEVEVAMDPTLPGYLSGFCISKACHGMKDRRRLFRARP